MTKFKNIICIGEPVNLRETLEPISENWFGIASATEFEGPPVRFKETLKLDFKPGFNVEKYLSFRGQIESWIEQIEQDYGPVDAIIGPSEYTIEIASRMRERFKKRGWHFRDSEKVRNKVVMKQHIASSVIATPKFLPLTQHTSFDDLQKVFAEDERVIIKPAKQAGSRGVIVCETIEIALEQMKDIDFDQEHLIEEFLPWPIMHIDGCVRGNELLFLSAGRYLEPCLEWLKNKKAMGSSLIVERKQVAQISNFVLKVIEALGIQDMVFHLEAFYKDNELAFLEIAGRPGGAGIVEFNSSIFDVDLQEEMLRAELGLEPRIKNRGILEVLHDQTISSGGWVVTPFPSSEPFRVRGFRGLENLPQSIFKSELPYIGKLFNKTEDDGLPSGKFFVKASSEIEARKDLQLIAQSYQLLGEEEGRAVRSRYVVVE